PTIHGRDGPKQASKTVNNTAKENNFL
ncbi:MAG: hypothetical protein RI883_1782, partial [Bacteroidota bacterium]